MSMSHKDHDWDNSSMELFFHSLKTEMIYFNKFKILEEVKYYVINHMIFYNYELYSLALIT